MHRLRAGHNEGNLWLLNNQRHTGIGKFFAQLRAKWIFLFCILNNYYYSLKNLL